MKHIFPLAFLALAFSTLSCGSVECEKDTDPEVLYQELSELVKNYTDSLRSAPDSAAAAAIANRFEARLAKVNYNYPPETDFKMTEEQNDSLFAILGRFAELRNRLEKTHLTIDTVKAEPEADVVVP